jgi:hypothetical protein
MNLSYNPSVVLHGSVAEAFMHLAITEGLIKYDYMDDIMEDILAQYRKSRERRSAIETLLLYDKLFISGCLDCFDFGCLFDSKILSVFEPDESMARGKEGFKKGVPILSADQHELAVSLRDVIKPFFCRKWNIVGANYDKLIDFMSHPDFTYQVKNDKNLFGISFLAYFLETELIPFIETVKFSAINNSAMETNWIRRVSKHLRIHPDAKTLALPSNIRRAYAIMLEEVRYLPTARNLQEALDLRTDKRITDFRNTLWRWAIALQNDSMESEAKLRKEMRNANAELRKLRFYREVTRYLTYLSLPLCIVPYIGLPIATLGLLAQTHIDYKSWQHRWMMLGK